MKLIRSDGIKTLRPHPEKPCEARRLEGSTLARPCLWPSFETHASKSAVADFDTNGCRSRAGPTSVRAPQDEVERRYRMMRTSETKYEGAQLTAVLLSLVYIIY